MEIPVWQWQNTSSPLRWTSTHKHAQTVWSDAMCVFEQYLCIAARFNRFFLFFFFATNIHFLELYLFFKKSMCYFIRAFSCEWPAVWSQSPRVVWKGHMFSEVFSLPLSACFRWDHPLVAQTKSLMTRPLPAPALTIFPLLHSKTPLLSPSSREHTCGSAWVLSSMSVQLPPPHTHTAAALANPVIVTNRCVFPDSDNRMNALLHHSWRFTLRL